MRDDDEFKFGNDEFELPMQITESEITNSKDHRSLAEDQYLVEAENMIPFKFTEE